MYFKSLELIGFKSFADKTKLNFESGVTAIVGPNGTGKSNIADAIRWVLGEQSAKSLRASSMQDVIFNGTDNKEPINLAEVSLTFSNEKRVLPIDYDEVTITRRVFRSNETEYLLNKTPVRLKDISELLMGTGIGTESYSIMEQGKMDLILSSKPEDRRFVFEEASGITKYKAKKKEAMRKLEQTEQNILRINDIIQEVKRQIGSIERQARKAEKYKVEFEKLKELEMKTGFTEYRDLKTQVMTHSLESEDSKARERDLDADVRTTASKISEDRSTLNEVSQALSDLRARRSMVSNSLDMNTQKIGTDRERVVESGEIREGLKKEIESAREKIRAAGEFVAKLKDELAAADGQRLAGQKAVAEKELQLENTAKEIAETEEKVKTLKVQAVDYLAKETRIKNELIKIGADVQNRRARLRRLSLEKETVGRELEEATASLDGILKEFAAIEEKAALSKQALESKMSGCAAALAEIKSLEESISREENKAAAAKSKVELLEESVKHHEGFSLGVKSLLANGSAPSGIVGVLADMIKVARGYEEAVNTFLADDAQVIIVERDGDIGNIISYLKDNRLGKASFVSLETVSKLKAQSSKLKEYSDIMPLRNFVKVNSGLELLLDYFFKNAYLAGSIKEAQTAFVGDESAVAVTKSGEMFDNGKVSGGSSSDTDEALLVGRRQRIEDLKAELDALERAIADTRRACGEKKAAADMLESEVASLEESVHAEDINFANTASKRASQEASAGKLREEFSLLESEIKETEDTIGELSGSGEALNAELNNIESRKASAQEFIDHSLNLAAERRSSRERLTLDIATLKAEAQAQEKDVGIARNNLKSQEAVLYELEETLYSKEGALKESLEKTRLLEEEILRLQADNGRISGEIKAIDEEAAVTEKAKSEIAERLGAGEPQLKEKEALMDSLRNQIRDLDVKLTELNYRKTALRDRILQSYKSDLEELHMEPEEGVDWEAVRSQVAELKERLDGMGPVNLIAIDEHKELEERYSFLTHQHEDLVNAKDSLLKAIQKINKTTKELFIDAFVKIQAEFKNFFRMLFGGGQAELVLIDEQDVLESGIEIIVRPPGKKLQNIMLLSGGEKALTAIALLFSIFKVKPSPFCVLDEIDAPLDESNVLRFSNVLKDFLKMSQFIIITHNKRTIELADVMYGITMQERGVSKIVSVKFLDEKKKVNADPAPQAEAVAQA